MSADCGVGEGGPETCATEAQSGPYWSQSTLQFLSPHPEPSQGRWYWFIVLSDSLCVVEFDKNHISFYDAFLVKIRAL